MDKEPAKLNPFRKMLNGIGSFRKSPKIFGQERGGVSMTRFGLYTENVEKTMDENGKVKSQKSVIGEVQSADQFVLPRPGGGAPIDTAKAMASYKNFVFAATNAVAREVQNIDFRLFQVKGKKHNELEEHPLLDMLDSVNDALTGPELKWLTSAHMDLTGNAYWYLEGVKNELDTPDAIHPIDPSTVRVLVDKSSFPFRLVGYKVRVGNRDQTFEPYQILHLRIPNPSNPFEGVGPVQNIAEWIDNDNYAMAFNRKFFVNGARVAGFLVSDYIADTQLEALKIGFADMHEGVDNMNRVAVLPKGVKWQDAGSNPKDMDFRNLSMDMRDRILAGFGVSKTVLGTSESDTNRATAETADYVFAKRVVRPRMQLICSYLNEKLVPRYGDDLYLTFVDPVPEDKTYRIEEMKAATGGQPVMTINEAREEFLGLGPVDGGDMLMTLTTFAPAGYPSGDAGDVTPEAESAMRSMRKQVKQTDVEEVLRGRVEKAANGERVAFRPVRTKLQQRAKMRKGMRKALEDKIEKELREILSNPTKSFEEDAETKARRHGEFEDKAKKTAKKIQDGLRELNAKQMEEVLKKLEKLDDGKDEKAIDPAGYEALKELFDIDEWIGFTVDMATPYLKELYSDVGKDAAAQVGVENLDPLSDDAASDALAKSIKLMAESYQQTTLDTLEEKIGKFVEEGKALADISKEVQTIYEWSDDWRADRVSKTESFRTANAGQREAWKQSGVVKTMVWYTTAGACPFCDSLNGKVVSIDENFFDKGDKITVDGQSMDIDYADVGDPPLHPNCNCFTRPKDVSIE